MVEPMSRDAKKFGVDLQSYAALSLMLSILLHTFSETYSMERGSNPSEESKNRWRYCRGVSSEASHVHIVSYRSYSKILLGRLEDYESNVQPPPFLPAQC
jgi:hypothetical protein